ncbi:hypothetical protein LCGC14_0398770, partial [marine sediment metagenome]
QEQTMNEKEQSEPSNGLTKHLFREAGRGGIYLDI